MTRQDYEKIADAINRSTHDTGSDTELCLNCLAHELGLVFENDNPRFDWGKWEAALGIEGDDGHE